MHTVSHAASVVRARALPLLALSLLIAGCATGPGRASATADSAQEGPARIVALGGPVTEALFALGMGDRVVGVDLTSTYPAEAAALPRVGYIRQLSTEGLLALEPDLVLASPDAGPPPVMEQVRAAVTVVDVPAGHTAEAALAGLRTVGKAVGREAQAESLAAAFERDLAAAAAVEGAPMKALVLYARGQGDLYVSGRGTAGDAMLALAGGVNAAADVEGAKPLSAEAMIAAAPEVLVVARSTIEGLGGEDAVFGLPGVAGTPAGREKRLIVVEDARLFGFGASAGAAALELAHALRQKPVS